VVGKMQSGKIGRFLAFSEPDRGRKNAKWENRAIFGSVLELDHGIFGRFWP
jgi:hypothetical protein